MPEVPEINDTSVMVVDEPGAVAVGDDLPEGLVEDLNLADHLRGYWPSSKNVTQ